MNPTAEVWFPLSKRVCLVITHDEGRKRKFFELLEAERAEEARAVQLDLPEITSRDVGSGVVQAVNQQTVANADRFVFAPSELDEIPKLFKGECQNYRIVIS